MTIFPGRLTVGCALVLTAACASAPQVEPADTLLTNGRVYTFAWDDPAADGTPAANAPHTAEGWRPDAEAVAIRAGRIVFTGPSQEAEAYRGPSTRVVDLEGATAMPGLVDSHVHIRELGQAETQLDLAGVATEEEAVERAVAYAATVPKGEWVVGRGWDEGAWAGRYPTLRLLSERVPDHPVVLDSLHGFAVWGNKLAFEKAGITRATKAPVGGEILKDAKGEPVGHAAEPRGHAAGIGDSAPDARPGPRAGCWRASSAWRATGSPACTRPAPTPS